MVTIESPYIDCEGNAVIEIPIEIVDPDGGKIEGNLSATDPKKVYEEIRNSKGEVLCEYYLTRTYTDTFVLPSLQRTKCPLQ